MSEKEDLKRLDTIMSHIRKAQAALELSYGQVFNGEREVTSSLAVVNHHTRQAAYLSGDMEKAKLGVGTKKR